MSKPLLIATAVAAAAVASSALAQDVRVRAGGGTVSVETNTGSGGISGSAHSTSGFGQQTDDRTVDPRGRPEDSSVDAQTSPGGYTSKEWEGGRNRTGRADAPPGGTAATSGTSSGPGAGVSSSATSGPGGSTSETRTR